MEQQQQQCNSQPHSNPYSRLLNSQPTPRTNNYSYNNHNPSQQQQHMKPSSPYGLQFGDELKYKRQEQQKYREELDYLCSLRSKRNYAEAYNNKNDENAQLKNMNDRYNFDKQIQREFMREYRNFNEREMVKKRQEKENLKRESYNEYLSEMSWMHNQNDVEQKAIHDKKLKWKLEQEKDLINFYQKKEQDKKEKMKEDEKNEALFREEGKKRYDSYSQYKNKIMEMNNRIYNNAQKYSWFLGNNPKELEAKNDFEYNKLIAEMHSKEKRDRWFNTQVFMNERDNERKEEEKYQKQQLDIKLEKQNNYKSFLDKQNDERRMEKENMKKSWTNTAEQLLMPSYKYPNLPKPVMKQAYDPINFKVRTPIMEEKERYLGDSRLRHNPITNPVDDFTYNRYLLNDINNMTGNNERHSYSKSNVGNNYPMNMAENNGDMRNYQGMMGEAAKPGN